MLHFWLLDFLSGSCTLENMCISGLIRWHVLTDEMMTSLMADCVRSNLTGWTVLQVTGWLTDVLILIQSLSPIRCHHVHSPTVTLTVHSFYYFNIHFNIILLMQPAYFKCCHSFRLFHQHLFSLHTCRMPCVSHRLWFYCPSFIWWGI